MRLFDKTLTVLERSLDLRLERQAVLAGNLANANTPGFRPLDLDVDARLAAEFESSAKAPAPLEPTSEGNLHAPLEPVRPTVHAGTHPALREGVGTTPGLDGNAVDLDRTMTALSQNALQYSAAAKAVQKKLALLRYVASDGIG